jgi:D-serine deaminase-like pyridoxal phosphate-dependent protein
VTAGPEALAPAPTDLLAPTDWDVVASPALVVDVGRLDSNIRDVAATFADRGVALRPHFKTSKCLAVAARQRAAGAVGFTCATPEEVAALGAAGFDGLLWAHQAVGPPKVVAAVDFSLRWRVTVLVDSLLVARPISDEAMARGARVDCLLEIDTGHRRTGALAEEAVPLAREIGALPGLRLRGIATHEGHLAALDDRERIDTTGREVGSAVVGVATALAAAGVPVEIVSVGSTPGLASAPWVPGVTEGRPGTYVYYDANQVRLGTTTLDRCALSVVTRVVSVRGTTAIVDAGLKAMSSDALTAENGAGIVVDERGRRRDGVCFAAANEEHGFLRHTGDLAVGDILRVIPNHACGTSNMWSRLLAIEPDGSTAGWDIVGRH